MEVLRDHHEVHHIPKLGATFVPLGLAQFVQQLPCLVQQLPCLGTSTITKRLAFGSRRKSSLSKLTNEGNLGGGAISGTPAPYCSARQLPCRKLDCGIHALPLGHGSFLKYLRSLPRELRRSMTTIFRCHICNLVWPTTNSSPISCPRMSKN